MIWKAIEVLVIGVIFNIVHIIGFEVLNVIAINLSVVDEDIERTEKIENYKKIVAYLVYIRRTAIYLIFIED